MNRRDFLKLLGLGAVTVATPKFIFDYGANLYKQNPVLVIPDDHSLDAYRYTYPYIFKEEYVRLSKNIYYQGHPIIKGLDYTIGESVVIPIKF